MEFPRVILSTVAGVDDRQTTGTGDALGFTRMEQRVNVATSRMWHQLVIVSVATSYYNCEWWEDHFKAGVPIEVPVDPQPGWLERQLRNPVIKWDCTFCGWENRTYKGRYNIVCGGSQAAQRAGGFAASSRRPCGTRSPAQQRRLAGATAAVAALATAGAAALRLSTK